MYHGTRYWSGTSRLITKRQSSEVGAKHGGTRFSTTGRWRDDCKRDSFRGPSVEGLAMFWDDYEIWSRLGSCQCCHSNNWESEIENRQDRIWGPFGQNSGIAGVGLEVVEGRSVVQKMAAEMISQAEGIDHESSAPVAKGRAWLLWIDRHSAAAMRTNMASGRRRSSR